MTRKPGANHTIQRLEFNVRDHRKLFCLALALSAVFLSANALGAETGTGNDTEKGVETQLSILTGSRGRLPEFFYLRLLESLYRIELVVNMPVSKPSSCLRSFLGSRFILSKYCLDCIQAFAFLFWVCCPEPSRFIKGTYKIESLQPVQKPNRTLFAIDVVNRE